MIPEVRVALHYVKANEAFPCKWTAIDAFHAVCDIAPDVFAKHPRLRNVCFLKIMQLRRHKNADDDVLEALERLRTVLKESLHADAWVPDEEFDEEFRAGVQNPDLVFDGRDTDTELCEAIQERYCSSDEDSE
jgi:hypothetical protein